MTNEDFKKITEGITEKIGKEKASLVADDFAKIISDNMQTNKTLKEKDDKIATLEKDKENLMTTNMNLLQQIPMGTEEDIKPKINKKEDQKPLASAFDFSEVLDEFGNFKK